MSGVQTLESRTLLAAVYWDGDAGDFQWSTAANWDTDTVPGPADTVEINVPGDITVSHSSGSTTVAGLDSEESLHITGGSLTVTAPSLVNGAITLDSGVSLSAAGAGATLTVADATAADGSNLSVSSGATMSLPNLTSYAHVGAGGVTRSLVASGAGSVLNLPGLTNLTGPADHVAFVAIQATGGGTINLPVLTQINVPIGINVQPRGVAVIADGTDSLVSMPLLTDFIDGGQTSGSSIEIQ